MADHPPIFTTHHTWETHKIAHQYSPLITHGKLMADQPPIFTTHHMWETHGRSTTNIHHSSHVGNSQQIAHRLFYCFRIGNKSMKTLHFVSGRGRSPTNIHYSLHMGISWQITHQYSPLITCGQLMTDHSPIFITHHTW